MRRTSIVALRAIAALSLAALLIGGVIWWHAARALRAAAGDVRAEQEFRFAAHRLPSATKTDFEFISAPAVFLQAASFQDHLYLAGPSGLYEYDQAGNRTRSYAVGRELPGSPLIAVATAVLADSHESELLIATAGEGILAFNGRAFRQIRPESVDVRAITTMLPVPSGHLLIGTKKRGVLVYDGKQMTPLHSTLSNLYVTALTGDETDLWVGTLDRGVLHFHAGQTETFSEGQGLPDPRVHSLALFGDSAYVGTSLGVAVFSSGQFSRVLASGVLATSLLATEDKLFVGSEDQGVISIPLAGRRPNPNLSPPPGLAEVHQLLRAGENVLAVTRTGLYQMAPHALAWKQVLQPTAGVLTDANISALAADSTGRLWVGYFDRGLDLLSPDTGRLTHVENEHVFCVNRIFSDSRSDTVDVATANGLVRFDRFGNEQQVLTRSDGLIADHITDVAAYEDGLALATPAGLTFLNASGAHSMYAFHGLVNNHIYALGVAGDELMAGTLGGISVLNQGNVMVNYTTSTSNLKHNWITAVVPVGAEWFVGTYGAGILALDRSGHFRSFQGAAGEFEINPNAMLVTPAYVLAGSLGKGLFIYDRQTERWSAITEGLPSLNVTAFAERDGFVYIGTDNGLVRIAEQKLHI